MLPALIIAVLLCLILAVAATVASCLIPELTVAGIWGIPVLGFALLVGAIFRIAVYYDPRVPHHQDQSKPAFYVAVCLLCYLIAWSSLDLIFQKEQHVAAIVGSTIGALTILGLQSWTEYHWMVHQTAEMTFPTIFELKRFFSFNSASLYLIACIFGMEGLKNGVRPIVIFFAYSNWITLAAVYYGIYRETNGFASNGTIRERLATWIRSKMQPGSLLSSLKVILTVLFFTTVMIEALCQMPSKYIPIGKGLFAGVAAVSFYTATRYDPRKPPETSRLLGRVIGVFAHFGIQIYFEWYVQNINRKSNAYAFEVHSVTLLTIFLLVELLIMGVIFAEIAPEQFRRQYLFVVFHVLMYIMSTVLFLLFHIAEKHLFWKTAMLALSTMWYYYTTLDLIAAIAGKYREVARQVPPVQAPPEVRVEVFVRGLGVELSRPPTVENSEQSPMKDPPFIRHQRTEAAAANSIGV